MSDFQDSFQYRTQAEIRASLPDLKGPTPWSEAKIVRVRLSNLRLLAQAKERFKIRLDTVWLAETYFQRYFSQYAFQTNTPVIFVAACIHLACKASDIPRKLEEVIKETFRMRYSSPKEADEKKKIDDFMFYTEVKERVLLAERALLYCFSFDFRTGDPYSFALKYHTTYKLLGEDDRQRYFSWLNIVAQGTTLCLQYPASLLGLVAVWYAQHLVYGEIPLDEDGLEWWEKLPAERQNRIPVPQPTAEQIEDAHWQLVPHANWVDERARLKEAGGTGRLPGEGCHCKVCSLHYELVEQRERAAAQGQTSPQGASDTSATTTTGIPGATTEAPTSLSSAQRDTRQAGDAAAPLTGPAAVNPAEGFLADTHNSSRQPTSQQGNPSLAPPSAEATAPTNASSAKLHQNGFGLAAASAQQADVAERQYSPAAGRHPGVQSQHRASPSWHGHQSPAGGLRQRPGSCPSSGQSAARLRQESSQPAPSHQLPHRPATAAAVSRQQPSQQSHALRADHTQHARAPQGHEQAYSPVVYSSQSSPAQQQQHWQQPRAGLSRLAGQQNDHPHTAAAADEDSGPEEGEIEEGEVLPDEAEAEVPTVGKRHDADVNMSGVHAEQAEPVHRPAQHAGVESGTVSAMRHDRMPDVADTSAKKRKRSVSPDAACEDETQDSSRRRLSPQHSPIADSGGKKRKRSVSLDPDPATDLGSQSHAKRRVSPIV